MCKVERREQAGDPVSLQPGLQPSGQEVAQGRPVLPRSSVYLSIYNNLPALGLLFWVPGSYEALEVQEKKKNPASQKPTDSRISASLAPGLGDSAWPHSARDGGNPVPVL